MARVRFAPSPTGLLHLGSVRTALFNYLYSKSTGGSFILRIEDTDKARFVPGSVQSIQDSLRWLGLHPDEGPCEGGAYGPYVQSERYSLYQKYAKALVEAGYAYPCFCSKERLQSISTDKHTVTRMSYDGYCRRLSRRKMEENLQMGLPHTIRLMVPSSGTTKIPDLVYGEVNVANSEINDQVLLKSDGTPTYHLASVVDDHYMEISHVLRGEEWLLSTAKHMLLYLAFNWTPPTFAHLPLLVSSSGTKLSKRKNDVFIDNYKSRGFQPEALVNFIALLGWGPSTIQHGDAKDANYTTDQEILSIDELTKSFSLLGINRKPAAVNESKLEWMNKHYFKQKINHNEHLETLTSELIAEVSESHSISHGNHLISAERTREILLLLQDRYPFIPSIVQEASYFWIEPLLHSTMFSATNITNQVGSLEFLYNELKTCDFHKSDLDDVIKRSSQELGVSYSKLMLLSRLALTGSKATPGLSQVMRILGKDAVLDRINHAIAVIGDS